MENVQKNTNNAAIISNLFTLTTNTSLIFISLLMLVYVFLSGSVHTATNVSYLDSIGIGEAPYSDFTFWDYFSLFKDSPFAIVSFFIALAPISFLRKTLSYIVVFITGMLGTFFILAWLLISVGEYNLYLVTLQAFIKEFSLYLIGCSVVAFLTGSLLYYVPIWVSSSFESKFVDQGGVINS